MPFLKLRLSAHKVEMCRGAVVVRSAATRTKRQSKETAWLIDELGPVEALQVRTAYPVTCQTNQASEHAYLTRD